MVNEGFFGPWGQILLVVIGALAIVALLLLIACFVTPGCIGYECVRRRKRKKNVPVRCKNGDNENVKLNDISYRSWRLGSLYDIGTNGSISENIELPQTVNSTNISFENVDTSSTLNLIQASKQKVENKPKPFPTELTMSLQYLPPCDDTITGKFVIGIEALSGLPPKQYNCTLEPYVALNIVKQSWSHRKRQKLHSFRTRGIRHTASPIYKETFVVANVKPHELRDWILDITAYDQDKYANHTELCYLKVSLKEVKKVVQSPEIHMFNFMMKPSNLEFGSILLGVSYLPTAQRLTINVMKARDVKFTLAVTSLRDFNPYVKVLMLNGRTGKKLQRRKTKFLRAISQPEFNETLTFDLGYNQLDAVQFLVILCSKVIIEVPTTGADHPSDSEESVNSYKKSRDIFIGKVALGKGVRGSTERLHWFSVLQNPRKLVTVWHTLK